jgi:hypothetical protein
MPVNLVRSNTQEGVRIRNPDAALPTGETPDVTIPVENRTICTLHAR